MPNTIYPVSLRECEARSALECGGKRQRHAAFGGFRGRVRRGGSGAPHAHESGVALTLATALQGASRSAFLQLDRVNRISRSRRQSFGSVTKRCPRQCKNSPIRPTSSGHATRGSRRSGSSLSKTISGRRASATIIVPSDVSWMEILSCGSGSDRTRNTTNSSRSLRQPGYRRARRCLPASKAEPRSSALSTDGSGMGAFTIS